MFVVCFTLENRHSQADNGKALPFGSIKFLESSTPDMRTRRLRGWRLSLRDGAKALGSLLRGLYDKEGLLHHVGFTTALADTEKPARSTPVWDQ